MKTLLILAACVAAALAGVPSDQEIQAHWETFKATHGKTYASAVEEAYRAKVFKENAIRIAKHNDRFAAGEVTFKVGYNQYADMVSVASLLQGTLPYAARSAQVPV